MDQLRRRRLLNLDTSPQPILPKDEACVQEAMQKMEGHDDWNTEVLRFSIQAHFWMGLRPKELRLAKIRDLDTATVDAHVRAEGLGPLDKWQGSHPHHGRAPAVVIDFLDKRMRRLEHIGRVGAEPLVPDIVGGTNSGDARNKARYRVFRLLGIAVTIGFRDLRSRT